MLKAIINAILDGKCTLFLGAGFSLGAKNIAQNEMQIASDFANQLYSACEMEGDGDLSSAAEYYKEKFGTDELINILRSTFYASEPTVHQLNIADLQWRSIYTINYDNVFETSLSLKQKVPNSTTTDTLPSNFKDRQHLVVHVNGSVETLEEGMPIPNLFKLTDVSYATDDFLKSSWHSQLVQDLRSSEYTIFIGCSLRSDLDLKRILLPISEAGPRPRAIFIVREGENAAVIRNLSRYGMVYPIGLNGLNFEIEKQKLSHVKPQSEEVPILSFHKYSLPTKTKFADPTSAFDLLFGGKIDFQIFFHSVLQSKANPYYFDRQVVSLMHQGIRNGHKNLLVISDIGNGKSIAIEALAYNLIQDDFQVFRYNRSYDSVNLEIEAINKETKPVIILESYNQNKEIIANLYLHRRNPNLVIIVTERTALYETSIQTLEKLSKGAIFELYDINTLQHSDVEQFSSLLTAHGLWGNDTGLTDAEKKELITRKCNSTTREVLLHLLQSENIISKFSSIIDSLNEKKEYYQAIVLVLIANRFNIAIDFQYLNQVLNTQNIRTTNFDKNIAIRELIDIQYGTIRIRSSIVAEALLEHVSDVKPMIEVIVNVCKTIDEWNDEISTTLKREFISYGNLKWLCERPGEDVNQVIYYFFEQVRNLDSFKANHHYWLQHAILDIERKNYSLAHTHLESAYAIARAKSSRYDTYQLDNQSANLLLRELLEQDSPDEGLKKITEAHKILTRNSDPNRLRHYPYKVAEQYSEFYNRFYSLLSVPQKKALLRLFDEMVKKMDEYLGQVTYYREKSYVRNTRNALSTIVESHRGN